MGEADRIVRFLTEERGQVDVYVRRARSSTAFCRLLDVGNLAAPKRIRGKLPNLVSADLVASPKCPASLEGNLLLSWAVRSSPS